MVSERCVCMGYPCAESKVAVGLVRGRRWRAGRRIGVAGREVERGLGCMRVLEIAESVLEL